MDAAKLAYIPAWANDQGLVAEEIAQTRRAQGWEGDFVVMHAGNMGLAQNLERLEPAALDCERALRSQAGRAPYRSRR